MSGPLPATRPLPARPAGPADALAALRAAIGRLDGERGDLAAAGDVDALAVGLAGLRTLQRDLRALADAVEADVAALMDGPRLVVDGLGVLERHRRAERVRWDGEAILQRLVRLALDPDGTGELPASPIEAVTAVIGALAECSTITLPSTSWRTTALRARGIDVDGEELRSKEPGRPTVQIIDAGGLS